MENSEGHIWRNLSLIDIYDKIKIISYPRTYLFPYNFVIKRGIYYELSQSWREKNEIVLVYSKHDKCHLLINIDSRTADESYNIMYDTNQEKIVCTKFLVYRHPTPEFYKIIGCTKSLHSTYGLGNNEVVHKDSFVIKFKMK